MGVVLPHDEFHAHIKVSDIFIAFNVKLPYKAMINVFITTVQRKIIPATLFVDGICSFMEILSLLWNTLWSELLMCPVTYGISGSEDVGLPSQGKSRSDIL